MTLHLNSMEHVVIKLWIISLFLDAYSFANIGTYYITAFTYVSILAIVFFLVKGILLRQMVVFDKSRKIALVFIIYIMLNFIITNSGNFTSPLKACSFLLIFILCGRYEQQEQIEQYFSLFSKLMDIMAIYGIYQFVGRVLSWPFSNIWIEDHMVPGYNWTNRVHALGNRTYRSNAIFLEPSFFGQFLALNIICHIFKIVEGQDRNNKKHWIQIMISGMAMIFSFSGTGFIVLGVGTLLFFLHENQTAMLKRMWKFTVIVLSFAIMVIVFGMATETGTIIVNSFISRITELTGQRGTNMSGYIRFISPYSVIKGIWSQDITGFLFGGGMGSATYYNNLFGGVINNSGYFKVAGELGAIGLIIYISFLVSLYKKTSQNRVSFLIVCALIPMLACHEGFLQNYDWIFIYVIGARLLSDTNAEKAIV